MSQIYKLVLLLKNVETTICITIGSYVTLDYAMRVKTYYILFFLYKRDSVCILYSTTKFNQERKPQDDDYIPLTACE